MSWVERWSKEASCNAHEASRTAVESAIHAFEVLAGFRVDFDPLAFLHEERNVDDGARGERRRLARAACRIALDTRFAQRDLQNDVGGKVDPNRVSFVQCHVDAHAITEPLGVIADLLARDRDLLAGCGVHEHEIFAFGIDVLERAGLDVGHFDFFTTLERALDDGTRCHVLRFDAGKRLAFTGFDELCFNNKEGRLVAVEHHFEAFFNVVCRVHAECSWYRFWSDCCGAP